MKRGYHSLESVATILRNTIVVNHQGELLGAKLTEGNVHDTVPAYDLLSPLWGKVYADKGCLSEFLKGQLGQAEVKFNDSGSNDSGSKTPEQQGRQDRQGRPAMNGRAMRRNASRPFGPE